LPANPAEQNRLWYRIYKSKQDDSVVKSSHGRWLLFRELGSLSFLFLIVLSALSFFNDFGMKSAIYSLFLLIHFALISVATQNTEERFACNVLAR
jgi:hypothetical protein